MRSLQFDVASVASVLLLSLALTSPSGAVVWHVNPQGTGDAPTIQAAYDAASFGDLILLAPGVYTDSNERVLEDYLSSATETVQAVAFAKAGVNLESSGGADQTTIDAESVRHGIVGVNLGYVQIRGVSIINATTSASGGGFSKWGGAILTYDSVLLIENCRFVDCSSPAPPGGGGAAVFLAGGSGTVFRGNLFLRGQSSQLGGAIELFYHHNALIENNTFVENVANGAGGGILVNLSSATVRGNIFAGNEAGDMGAGFCCINSSSVDASCNVFWENDAAHDVDMAGCGTIGQDNNINADPLFCDAPNDVFTIDAKSPAAPDDPSGCGLRGAYPVGCGAVSVESESWGAIKSLYR